MTGIAPRFTPQPSLQAPRFAEGWLGPQHLPGYRARNIVAQLADLPEVYPDHLYFHLLLFDDDGDLADDLSGPCYAMARQQSLTARTRFVRVVAELARHAANAEGGLSCFGQALEGICRLGVDDDRLLLAAQMLDGACSDGAVVLSLVDMLEASLGADAAHDALAGVVQALVCRPDRCLPDALGGGAPQGDADEMARRVNAGGLASQLRYVVRAVGRVNARRHLREHIHADLVPTPAMLGL